jgi:hypothetical protein
LAHYLRARALCAFVRLKDESGQSLVLALVITASLMITTTGIIQYTTANEVAYGRDREAQRALNIAEAGLNNGMGTAVTTDPTDGTAIGTTLGPNYYTIDGAPTSGSTRPYWTATKTADKTWVITATGFSPSGAVSRQLQTTVYDSAITVTTQPQSPVYNYGFFIAGNSGCTNVGGSTDIQVGIWINNDLCTNGGAGISEPGAGNTLSVYIGGQFQQKGSAKIGSSAAPLQSVTIVKGCVNSNKVAICSNSSKSAVYANSYSSTPGTLVKPTINAASIYSSGMWSAPVCTTGSFTFDNDSTRNLSVGNANLFGGSYDCKVYDQTGTTLIGRLAYSSSTKTLTIAGTIFIDGNISWSSGGSNNVSYTGDGTIYLDGSFSSSGNELCGPPAAPGNGTCTGNGSSWDPTQGKLMIAAINAANASPGFNLSGSGELDIFAYTNGAFSESGGGQVTGPVLADSAAITGSPKIKVPTVAPSGAPGAAQTVTSHNWKFVAGGWRELK